MIHTVLLRPPPGYYHHLVGPGMWKSMPPLIRRHHRDDDALVLAFCGEPVVDGCDRAARVLADALLGARPPVPRYGYSVEWTAADALVVNDAGAAPTTWDLRCAWRDEVIEVEVAPPPPSLLPLLRPAWALATALVAKLGGEVETAGEDR